MSSGLSEAPASMTSSPNSGQKEHRKPAFLYFCCPGSPDFPEVSPEINKNLLLAAFRLPENCRTAVDKLSGSCRQFPDGVSKIDLKARSRCAIQAKFPDRGTKNKKERQSRCRIVQHGAEISIGIITNLFSADCRSVQQVMASSEICFF